MIDVIKGILFDFDGTLSRRIEAAYFMYRWCMHQILPEMDVHSVEFEAVVQRCMLWDEYGTIRKSHVFEQVKKHYCPALDVDYWTNRWYEVFHEFQIEMPEVYEVLTDLKEKYKLGIVTNGSGASQNRKIDVLDLRKYFDTVIASGDFGKDKPDVSIYEQAAKDLGLECSEVAFVGDTFATDILGAVKAGMKPVWFCYERKCVTIYDVVQLKNYKEVREYFLENNGWNS